MENRPSWSSEFAFIISAIGSAIGLGNIWRFPYVMGQNGGAAFLVVYLVLILLICAIPLIAELMLGKITQKDTIGAYAYINPKLKIFGWLNILTAILISSFYFVVGGWVFYYIAKSFALNQVNDFGQYFTALTVNPILSILLTFAFLLSCTYFVRRGVNKGIEIANKIMMPLLVIILIALMVVSLNLPNAHIGLKFLFEADFSKINFSVILAALGQALFSLSIGMGAILTYGSYLKKEDNVLKSAYAIIISGTIFAILVGVVIFPAVFSFGLEPNSGPGLVFITLPKIFTQIQHGGLVALGFFSLLFFAALTSGISILEVAVAAFMENFKMTRNKASLLMCAIVAVVSIPAALSFGVLKNLTLFNRTVFDIFDFLTANILMPLSSLVICILAAGLLKIANEHIFKNPIIDKIFLFVMKYILPIIFLILIVTGLS